MTLEAAFRPRWAGGWTLSRWIFVVAQAYEMLRQSQQILDCFRHPGFNFASGLFHLSNTPLISQPLAWGVWVLGALGLVGLGWGGRWARPGLVLWMLAEVGLFTGLGLEINAPERIMGWSAIGLLWGPIHEYQLHQKWRSPVGRWFFLIWISAMYAMAGGMKALEEPGWWDGRILAQGLCDPIMGGTSIGIWLSQYPWIPMLLGWFTLVFEISFGFLIWFTEFNPYILAMGLMFHLGVSCLMSVGSLGLTVVGAYPVLLDPDIAQGAWLWLSERFRAYTGGQKGG